ncbi:DUF6348 family protein [Streptacidiphilus griseoplanus]|uniref:DUF6348 family protein n=1 Tax=Peterkaempfera griseoplana TaxID=66896 RepID=UPI0006E2F93B|nr:DUF6348 family protein [Peterkaempfera griseoplana]
MRPEERLEVIQRSVVREMARYGRRFTVDGAVARGPGTTAVAVREHPDTGGGHVDLGYVLHLGRADTPVLWDCTAGLGKTEEEKLDNAVRMWATTTAATVVELLDARGEHGDHYAPDRPGGVPGWHAVQGPACVFGFGNQALAEWLGGNHVLPALAPRLAAELDHPLLNGVKLFLGGRAGDDVAEVRVNGEVSEPASAALRAMDWPRGERLAWARLCVLLLAGGSDAEAVRRAESGAAAVEQSAAAVRAGAPEPGQQQTAARPGGSLRRWWGARRAGR